MNGQYKLIFKGRLEFGSVRSYEMVLKMWMTRIENYYKTDIIFKAENIFNQEDISLVLPQQTLYCTEKQWRNTVGLLDETAQYAIAGRIHAWAIDNGTLVSHKLMEPRTDKAAVREYLLGRELLKETGRENEAASALSRAIEKFEKHALAYERRGYVNYKLNNFKDALYDFSKSIDLNPNNAEPYYGRGRVKMVKNDWEAAALDFDFATKMSIALQPLYWRSRLYKGECLFHAKRSAEAIKELNLFLQRNFAQDDPNFSRRRRAYYLLGKSLMDSNDLNGAIDSFNRSLSISEGTDITPDSENLLCLAISKKRAGKKEFASDLQAAAAKGSKEAKDLLSEWGI